jgi:hypothetical protein
VCVRVDYGNGNSLRHLPKAGKVVGWHGRIRRERGTFAVWWLSSVMICHDLQTCLLSFFFPCPLRCPCDKVCSKDAGRYHVIYCTWALAGEKERPRVEWMSKGLVATHHPSSLLGCLALGGFAMSI